MWRLYKTYVRIHLEFSILAWSTHTYSKGYIKALKGTTKTTCI